MCFGKSVPLDGGKLSEAIPPYVTRLAVGLELPVVLLTVIDADSPDELPVVLLTVIDADSPDDERSAVTAASSRLEAIALRLATRACRRLISPR